MSNKLSVQIAANGHRTFAFHVLGFVHLPCSRKYMSCAFTQKIHKLCSMLMAKGHRVYLYASEGSDAPCTKLIQTHTLAEIREALGDSDYTGPEELGYDWKKNFRFDWDRDVPLTRAVRLRILAEMEFRKKPDDFVLCPMGQYHQEVADKSGLYLVCESGIGYFAVSARFRVYESTFVRSFTRGAEGKAGATDGNNYYRVIPNYYPLEDFPFVRKPQGDANGEPYFLSMSRMIRRKGVGIAIDATRMANARLIICGQGATYDPVNHTLAFDGEFFQLTPKQTYLGYVGPEERKYLMGNAVATICPSIYMEPFCGVNAESQLCGTPAITSDFGAFSETVEHARTGYRCNTINDYVLAIKNAHRLDRAYTARRARSLWDLNVVNEQYEKLWQDMYDLWLSTLPNKPMDATTGKPRDFGFYTLRTAEEEAQAGTAQSYFSPQAPFDQIKPMPGVDVDEPKPAPCPKHAAMSAIKIGPGHSELLQRLNNLPPLSPIEMAKQIEMVAVSGLAGSKTIGEGATVTLVS